VPTSLWCLACVLQLSVDDISLNADVYGDGTEHSGNYNQLKVPVSSSRPSFYAACVTTFLVVCLRAIFKVTTNVESDCMSGIWMLN